MSIAKAISMLQRAKREVVHGHNVNHLIEGALNELLSGFTGSELKDAVYDYCDSLNNSLKSAPEGAIYHLSAIISKASLTIGWVAQTRLSSRTSKIIELSQNCHKFKMMCEGVVTWRSLDLRVTCDVCEKPLEESGTHYMKDGILEAMLCDDCRFVRVY